MRALHGTKIIIGFLSKKHLVILVRYHKEKNKDGLFKNIMPIKASKYYIIKKPWHVTLCKVT
jgi:hypothetical protein